MAVFRLAAEGKIRFYLICLKKINVNGRMVDEQRTGCIPIAIGTTQRRCYKT